jgi:hypothetical protein
LDLSARGTDVVARPDAGGGTGDAEEDIHAARRRPSVDRLEGIDQPGAAAPERERA